MMIAAVAMAAAAVPVAHSSPEVFVTGLYTHYRRNPDFSPLLRPQDVFSPRLTAAIRRDSALANGEVGFLDGDPLCDCQDSAGLRATVAPIGQPGPDTARMAVDIRFAGNDRRHLKLSLVRVAGAWRIADVASAQEPSLLVDLERENRRRPKRP
jgi:hypothetical protein